MKHLRIPSLVAFQWISTEKGALAILKGAACVQEQVKGPIIDTLKALPSVTKVEFRIDGAEFFDWDGLKQVLGPDLLGSRCSRW